MSSRFATLILLSSVFCIAGCGGSKDKADATADTNNSPPANEGNNSDHGELTPVPAGEQNGSGHGEGGSHSEPTLAEVPMPGGEGSEHADSGHSESEHADVGPADGSPKPAVLVADSAKGEEGHSEGSHGDGETTPGPGGLTALKPPAELPGTRPPGAEMPALIPLPAKGAEHGEAGNGENTVPAPGGLTALPAEQNGLNFDGQPGDKPPAVKEFMPNLREDLPHYAAVLVVRKVINNDGTGMSELISPTSRGLAADLRAEDNSEAMTKAGEMMGELSLISSSGLRSGEKVVNFRIGKTRRILRFTVKKIRTKYVVHLIQDIQVGK